MQVKYMLYIDDKPTGAFRSLDEAKASAAQHTKGHISLRIESYAAPAPSRIWIYDESLHDWVEQK